MSQKRSSYVKRLFRDFAHHPGLLILASLGTIAQVALTVWLPILIGHAVDLVINPQGMTVLWPVFDPNGSGHCGQYPDPMDQSSCLQSIGLSV